MKSLQVIRSFFLFFGNVNYLSSYYIKEFNSQFTIFIIFESNMKFSFRIAAVLSVCYIGLPSLLTSEEVRILKEDEFVEAEIAEAKEIIHEQKFEPFNQTNPHQDSYCPKAVCNNSPLCQPCKKRFLFIVATGRSGSTTLLHMLNYLPNVSETILHTVSLVCFRCPQYPNTLHVVYLRR